MTTYTDVDYLTATMGDVILSCSLTMHPTLLAEATRSTACETHQRAAATMHDGEAKLLAEMAWTCRPACSVRIRDSATSTCAALCPNRRVIVRRPLQQPPRGLNCACRPTVRCPTYLAACDAEDAL